MRRLPEVVGLVAVGDDGPHGRRQADRQNQLERGVAWKRLIGIVEPTTFEEVVTFYSNL